MESRRHGLGLAGGRGPKKSNQVRFHCDLAHPRGKSSNARQVSKWNEKGWFLLTSNEISIRATGFSNSWSMFKKFIHFHDILNIFIDIWFICCNFLSVYMLQNYILDEKARLVSSIPHATRRLLTSSNNCMKKVTNQLIHYVLMGEKWIFFSCVFFFSC